VVEGVAYLVSQYPALSHTFVEREVAALRDLGVRVETFSVRPPDASAPFPPMTRVEVARTRVIQGLPARRYLADAVRLLLRSPRASLAGLTLALRSGPRTGKGRIWQLFYLAEAARLLVMLEQAGLHRIHVHHANNAADIARLTVALGNAAHPRGPRWRWTLAMHGPTEFLDAEGHDLPAKLRSAAAVACISDYARRTALALAPEADPARFGIVRMSAPAAAYRPAGDLRAARPAGPLSVLFVGRLVREKAPDALIEAVGLLRDRGVEIEAVLAGEGPLRPRLEELIERGGLQDVVRLAGPIGQDALPALYERADVFCLPSHAEGIPVVLMEAMLTELPVVTTAIAGIPELVGEDSGVLVEPGDAIALAAALQRLADRPEHRLALGRRGRAVVLERHAASGQAVALRELLLG
jgi:colanic acid/amylovoran biosynthesis glycosyltransferase